MPIRLPTYISKTAPPVVDRGGTSPASTGLAAAQGLRSVANVLADIHIDVEKRVGDAARLAEFVDRKGKFSDRIGQLEESLAQDADHTTYYDRAKKGIEQATTEAMAGINDPGLRNLMVEHVAGAKDHALGAARNQALKLKVDYTSAVGDEDLERQVNRAVNATDSRELMEAEGTIDATVNGLVVGGTWGARLGLEKRRKAREKIDTTLAARLADQEPGRFLKNYEEGVYKDSFIDPLRLEEIRRYATNRNEGVEASAVAGEVWDTYGPGAAGRVQTAVVPLEAGNIDLGRRPRVKNKDGSISTVRSMSFNIDGKEVLLPTVSDDGKILSEKQAVELFRKTGKHLGVFQDASEATEYAKALHEQQARLYTQNPDEAPVNLDLMVTAVEARFKGDPDKTRLAIAALKEKAIAHAKGSAERRDANLSTIYKAVVAGAGTAQVVASPEFSSLDGQTQIQVKEHLENRAWTMQQRAKGDPAQVAAQHEGYWRYSQPEVLAGMTENAITALYPKLGVDLTDDLMRIKRNMGKPGRMAEAKIDADDFNHYARTYGLSPEDKDDKAKLGEIRYRVENAIEAEQNRAGRPLSRKEKGELMRRGMVEVPVRARTKWLGFDLGESVMRKRLFDVESLRNVQIPQAERERIAADLSSRGLPADDEHVLDLYLRLGER